MLLNQFKTGSVAASTLGGSRGSAVVLRKVKNMGKPETVKATASGSEGAASPGWLETNLGKATSYVDKKLHSDGSGAKGASDMVEYKGTAVVVKKLKMLDLIDRVADAQDDAAELLQGKKVSIQLMSGEIDPSTGKGMLSKETTLEGWVKIFDPLTAEQIPFELKWSVPKSFGVPVAIFVKNTHPNEFLLENFHIDLPDKSVAQFFTNSWVFNTEKTEPIGPRMFFNNKAYLPHETPAALKELRAKELETLRGNGTGERIVSDRIYDYDYFNDLGTPDAAEGDPAKLEELSRPPLGGNKEFPFPRRVRTGRPMCKSDPKTETRYQNVYGEFYVPSDERFDYVKMSDNKADLAKAGGHIAQTKLQVKVLKKASFESIADVKKLFAPKGETSGLNNVLPDKADVPAKDQHPLRFLNELTAQRADGQKPNAFRFPIPQILKHSDTAWQTDSEFARENLAGLNPMQIKLVTEFPIKSKLGPEFGDPSSAITAKHIEDKLEGRTVEEALSEKKLFTVDHHDTFLPWVERINAQPIGKSYASRVLYFLSADETLKVVAIELVLPPMKGAEKVSRVYTPPKDTSKTDYIWEFAKAHAMSNEMTVHQSISHFTLCHAVTEPAIIASNRQLSKLHPMMQLLKPHFRHTLTTNSTARMNLLPTGGTIELIYTPQKYVVRMASVFYRDNWTFENNGLPKDLIKRGMAVPDSSAKHGVKLTIEDYPYASDGLELWAAMKSWNSEYIDIFYKDDKQVQEDPELQAWYKEYRDVGHGDKKDAPGWIELDSKESLAEIVTTIIWICTAMHAPINFGQYDYASWMPQHPTMTRRLIPEQGTKEWEEMQADPEKFWLTLISDPDNTTTAMAVFEVVAAHAPNEEYIAQRSEGWTENEKVRQIISSASFNRSSIIVLKH
ncbi:hypothetical protein KC19_10G154500 [Ceratodon purpureus]|uniref:Lipoxygenase n=1 Tax=Ceratodon purpureus TaxID=3225 RepID=A0A8T0GT11_CERPU|nr:hypothetical protein KC19_10G154500 [Ceratodon purpureus]